MGGAYDWPGVRKEAESWAVAVENTLGIAANDYGRKIIVR